MFISPVRNQAKTLLPFKDEKGSRGATLIKPEMNRGFTHEEYRRIGRYSASVTGRSRRGLLYTSPAQLPGPFEVIVCTAFTPPGGSLKHRFNLYSSRSTFLSVIELCNTITGFFVAVKDFDDFHLRGLQWLSTATIGYPQVPISSTS